MKMDRKTHIDEQEFRRWLGSRASRTPDGLDDRILTRVRKATPPAERAERRTERRLLIWTIVLGAFVLGIGIAALTLFTDWNGLFGEIRMPEFPSLRRAVPLDPQARAWGRSLLPPAGIVFLLLAGDLLLRRRFLKH
jgi:hypothetical protein